MAGAGNREPQASRCAAGRLRPAQVPIMASTRVERPVLRASGGDPSSGGIMGNAGRRREASGRGAGTSQGAPGSAAGTRQERARKAPCAPAAAVLPCFPSRGSVFRRGGACPPLAQSCLPFRRRRTCPLVLAGPTCRCFDEPPLACALTAVERWPLAWVQEATQRRPVTFPVASRLTPEAGRREAATLFPAWEHTRQQAV